MEKPIIAITMGDAAGIGPELIAKVLSQEAAWTICYPFVVGDPNVMTDICGVLGTDLRFRAIRKLSEARFSPPDVDVLQPEGLCIDHVQRGRLDPAMGKAAASCLQKAFEMAMDNEVQGVVSAPLNKEAFHLAGYEYMDELAYLADLTNSPEPFIAGVMGTIWTVAVTEHVPFRAIADLITKKRVLEYIGKWHHTLKNVGLSNPRIAVAALNVHAGEGGLFGREEIDEIGPAVQQAKEKGINVEGPVPADMVFVRALEGEFDGVVCMFHDQANIARKLQPKGEGATFFMGLPVVCGTTAHGTAFDKAGQGIADPGSLEAALKYTVMLASQVRR
jgi:4-hydroxythreonine-4-phosphate dehydrogenase